MIAVRELVANKRDDLRDRQRQNDQQRTELLIDLEQVNARGADLAAKITELECWLAATEPEEQT